MDDAVGKHDGSVKGMRYFKCRNNHGIFVKDNSGRLEPLPAEEQAKRAEAVGQPETDGKDGVTAAEEQQRGEAAAEGERQQNGWGRRETPPRPAAGGSEAGAS